MRRTSLALRQRALRVTAPVAAGVLTVALFSGGLTAASAAERGPDEPTAQRELLYDGRAGYPRVIRLEHSGAANGRLISTIESTIDNDGVGVIHESTDGGTTFEQIAVIQDPDGADGRGMCCGNLYELPSRVGDMPAGTLLFGTTTGFRVPKAERETTQRLWRSFDHGRTWEYLSDIAVAPGGHNGWEPELVVDAEGQLVALWADASDKDNHDQKISQARSADGVTWSEPRDTVINSDWYVRPGMPVVRLLPNGTYFLVYEVCNLDEPLCSLYFRTSKDGWDYGDPTDLGTGIRTADGKYPRHTPTLTWSQDDDGTITLLVNSEMLVNADGSHADGNGGTILVNDRLGEGPWREIPAPIKIDGVDNSGCKNFSSPILASPDGTSVLELATDLVDDLCMAFYATGPVPPA